MQVFNAVSFADAAVAWLRERDTRLSNSTERAYRGEVDRMAQFFAVKYGGLALKDFTQEHWQGYVEEVRGVREHVVSCRDERLSPSSAAQAIRIGSAFLRWARDEGLLSWAPKTLRTPASRTLSPERRRPLVDLSVQVAPLHPALEALLMNVPEPSATQESLRAQLAMSLAYWGGLRSSDIAALRAGDVATIGNAIELHHPRLGCVIAVEGNAASTWHQYRLTREQAGETLTRRSPVVAALRSKEPISAWGIWALIAQHIEVVTGIGKLYSAQSLRRARVVAMGAKCAGDIIELSKYSQRSQIDFATSAARMGT